MRSANKPNWHSLIRFSISPRAQYRSSYSACGASRKLVTTKLRIGALRVVLGFGDQAAVARRAPGAVGAFAKDALGLLGPGEDPRGLLAPPLGLPQQPAVLGHADDVIDVMALAPGQQQRAAEAGITAEEDAHARPRLAQPGHQQFHNRRRMQRRVVLRRAQIGAPAMARRRKRTAAGSHSCRNRR